MAWFILLEGCIIPQPPSFPKNLDLFLIQRFLCWSMEEKRQDVGNWKGTINFSNEDFFLILPFSSPRNTYFWQFFDVPNFFNIGETATVSYAGRQHGYFRSDICHLQRSWVLISISWWNEVFRSQQTLRAKFINSCCSPFPSVPSTWSWTRSLDIIGVKPFAWTLPTPFQQVLHCSMALPAGAESWNNRGRFQALAWLWPVLYNLHVPWWQAVNTQHMMLNSSHHC